MNLYTIKLKLKIRFLNNLEIGFSFALKLEKN